MDYNSERGLQRYDYILSLPSLSFRKRLTQLPQNAIWLDKGSGMSNAALDALTDWRLNNIGKIIAVDRKIMVGADMLRALYAIPQRLKLIDGGLIDDLEKEGKFDAYKNSVDIISDVYGEKSYGYDLAESLRLDWELLKPGGELIFNLMLHTDTDFQFFYNEVLELDGSISENRSEGLLKLLKDFQGFEVVENEVKDLNTSIHIETNLVVRMRKIPGSIFHAPKIETDYISHTPPYRLFIRH